MFLRDRQVHQRAAKLPKINSIPRQSSDHEFVHDEEDCVQKLNIRDSEKDLHNSPCEKQFIMVAALAKTKHEVKPMLKIEEHIQHVPTSKATGHRFFRLDPRHQRKEKSEESTISLANRAQTNKSYQRPLHPTGG